MSFKYFSERHNYKKVDEVLQIGSMNNALKNVLWSCIYGELEYMKDHYISFSMTYLNDFVMCLYKYFWKLPIDEIPYYESDKIQQIKYKFFNEYNWFEIYDFIEFMTSYFGSKKMTSDQKTRFINNINSILERENSGYRLIKGCVTPIIDKSEIKSLNETFEKSPLENIKIHFDKALCHLSDRINPDFRNSIKESISAVECICRDITGEKTLDKALLKLENRGIKIPDVLKKGMEKMYYWTNGEDGIRHALMDDSENAGFDEAKYMLIACSAFVNYIISKKHK